MKTIRAFDKKTDQFVGRQSADNKSEATRYSHNYLCLNKACDCTFHFRRAVRVKENTDHRPPTFVKNRSSKHQTDCPYDYSAFAEKHRDVISFDNDSLHFRIQFPLGGHAFDQRPWEKGALTQAQIKAAHNNIDKRGFATLREFVDFIENKFDGGLNDPVMQDVYLSYQGESFKWNDLWISSDNYIGLLKKAKDVDQKYRSHPVFSVIKPDHATRSEGLPKIVCRPQYAKKGYKTLSIKPVIICKDNIMAEHFLKIAQKEGNVLVASRPFIPEKQYGNDTILYFNTPSIAQLAQVAPEKYWHRISGPRHQESFNF